MKKFKKNIEELHRDEDELQTLMKDYEDGLEDAKRQLEKVQFRDVSPLDLIPAMDLIPGIPVRTEITVIPADNPRTFNPRDYRGRIISAERLRELRKFS